MVIVFGHTGFIGSRLYRHLEESGYHPEGISSVRCDLLDAETVRSLLAGLPRPFAIVNCAVINRSCCRDLEGMQQNLRMLRNILDALPPGACRLFIQLSSVDVYGCAPSLPITEGSPLHPATWYAMAKLDCEWLLGQMPPADFPCAILRLPGVYGAGDGGRSTVGRLFCMAANRDSIDLEHDGTLLRDYLLVDDLLRLVQMLLDEPRQLLVNLVSGRSFSLREIVDLIFTRTGTGSRVNFIQRKTVGATADLVFDNSRCREYLPGFAFTGLDEGLQLYAGNFALLRANS